MAMVNNNTPYFGMTVRFSRSLPLVRALSLSRSIIPPSTTLIIRYLFNGRPFTGNSCSPYYGLRADLTNRISRGTKFYFPVQNLVSRPFLIFKLLPFVFVFCIVEEMSCNGEQ